MKDDNAPSVFLLLIKINFTRFHLDPMVIWLGMGGGQRFGSSIRNRICVPIFRYTYAVLSTRDTMFALFDSPGSVPH